MKKVFVLLFVTACLLLNAFTVYATENIVYLSDLELQVTIPSNYYVATRTSFSDKRIFEKYGVTQETLVNYLKSSDIYLDALSSTHNEEIVVTMTKSEFSDFSSVSDTTLNTLFSAFVSEYESYGVSVLKYETYQNSQAKFLKIHFTDPGNTVYGLQYYTIYDGKAMNFTMRSYEGGIVARQENTIAMIVDSIVFDKEPEVVEQGENKASFNYTDTDSGTTFTVPANWKQEELTKQREFIDVKFVSTKDNGCTMIYGSNDMWELMSTVEKQAYTRSDINNSFFTKADIAEIYDMTVEEISTVTYNGVQYFKSEGNYSSDVYGVDISIVMTRLIRVDNGWMYMFQFSGSNTHKLYSDFESLLNSAQYPLISNTESIAINNSTDSKSNNITTKNSYNKENSFNIVPVVLVAIVLLIVIVVVMIRKRNNARTTKNYTTIFDTQTSKTSQKPEPSITCQKCGQSLPSNSVFCHKCGTKVETITKNDN